MHTRVQCGHSEPLTTRFGQVFEKQSLHCSENFTYLSPPPPQADSSRVVARFHAELFYSIDRARAMSQYLRNDVEYVYAEGRWLRRAEKSSA